MRLPGYLVVNHLHAALYMVSTGYTPKKIKQGSTCPVGKKMVY